MRLRSIELEGFQSYRDPWRLDLEDVSLAVVVGPNGVGKSTIVCDAVVFALFGEARTPTLDGVISTGLQKARVALEFDLADRVYRVVRVLQRGKAQEASLYQASAAGEWEPITEEKVSSTNAEIARRLGMSHDTFMATAFAAQGQAARFTGGCRPAERRAILADALGLERYAPLHDEAKVRLSAADRELADLTGQLRITDEAIDSAGDVSPHAQTIARDQASQARELLRRAQADLAAIPDEDAHLAGLQRLRDELAAAEEHDRQRQADLARQSHDAAGGIAHAERLLAESAADLARAERAAVAAEQAREHAARAGQAAEAAEAELERIQSQGELVRDALAQAESESQLLTQQINELTERIAGLRRSAAGGGGHCYTCRQELSPEKAEELLAAGAEDLRALHTRAEALSAQQTTAARRRAVLVEAYQTAQRRAQEARASATEHLQRGAHAQALAADAPTLRSRQAQAQEVLAKARQVAADVSTRLKVFSPDQRISTLQAQLAHAEANAPDAKVRTEREQAVAAAERSHANALTTLARLEQTADRVQTLLAQRTDLKRRRQAVSENSETLAMLRDAFAPTGIPAMILNGVVEELNADVQAVLDQLANHELVIDLRTQRETKKGAIKEEVVLVVTGPDGEPRFYESFSGGQQFRVDLALRVGLARMLSRRNGHAIETLLVDEGWGALDADGIRAGVAMLHALSEDFMVLTVTHREDVQEMFQTAITVQDRGGTSVAVKAS